MAKLAKLKTPDILGKLKGPGKSHLGIDIGNQTIKIVELRSTPRGMDLVHHATASTPPGGFQISVLAAQLKEMIQEGRVKNPSAGRLASFSPFPWEMPCSPSRYSPGMKVVVKPSRKCWLRQPPKKRSWSTLTYFIKRVSSPLA
jgi:hypothetical protein